MGHPRHSPRRGTDDRPPVAAQPKNINSSYQHTLSTLAASRDAVSMYPWVSFLLKRRVLRPALSSSSMSSKFVRDSADSCPSAKTTSCHRHRHRTERGKKRESDFIQRKKNSSRESRGGRIPSMLPEQTPQPLLFTFQYLFYSNAKLRSTVTCRTNTATPSFHFPNMSN